MVILKFRQRDSYKSSFVYNIIYTLSFYQMYTLSPIPLFIKCTHFHRYHICRYKWFFFLTNKSDVVFFLVQQKWCFYLNPLVCKDSNHATFNYLNMCNIAHVRQTHHIIFKQPNTKFWVQNMNKGNYRIYHQRSLRNSTILLFHINNKSSYTMTI